MKNRTPEEFLKAEQIEDCELQVGNVVLLSYPPQVPVKKLSQLLTDFASQSKPQLNIEKIVSGIVDSLGDTSEGNDYHIHSVNGNRWITHNEVGSGEPLKQWLKSEIEKHIEQSKPEEIEWLSEDEIIDAVVVGYCNWEDLNGFIEGAKWLQSELQTRIKPVDTKTVDAIDPTFWRRLEMFVSNIQVNDIASEEEKQYIIHVIESKK